MWSIVPINSELRTLNRNKCCSWGTLLSVESTPAFQSYFSLSQFTVTNAESLEFFPVCFAEVTAPFLSDVVDLWILGQLPMDKS